MTRRILLLLVMLFFSWDVRAQNTAAYPSSAATDTTMTLAADNAATTLSSNISAGAVTLPVASTTGFKTPTLLWIDLEEYKCLTKTATSFTSCTAGFDGTSQTTHTSTTAVSNFVSAYQHNQVAAEIEAVESDLIAGLPTARGGTAQTGANDDSVLVGNGTLWQQKVISDCIDSAGNHLNYTAATNSFSCGTTSSGGSVIFQVDGVTLTSSSTVNFQDSAAFNGLTITFSNPSAGNVKIAVSGTLNVGGLTNSSTTVNSTTCTLGSTCTVTAVPSETPTNTNILVGDGATWNSVALSGDCTITNAGVQTCTKINGNSIPSGIAAHQAIIGTAANTGAYKTIPDCTDTGGNHINYTQSSDSFSCGTTAGSGTIVPRHIQSKQGRSSGTLASLASRFNVANGSTVIVAACWIGSTSGDATVADNRGTTYAQISSILTGTNQKCDTFTGNTTSSGTWTVTPTYPSGNSFTSLSISEFDGTTVLKTADTSGATNGSSTSTLSITTTFAGDLIWAVVEGNGSSDSWKPASGFAYLTGSTGNDAGEVWMWIQPSAGVVDCSPNQSSDATYAISCIALKHN